MDSTVAALEDEQDVVAGAAAEPATFASLYDHYFSRVYNYVRYRLDNTDTADDVTSQVFERALANISRYRAERAPFAAWLFTIARNAVNDHLRSRKRRRLLSLEVLPDLLSADPPPEEAVARSETLAELLAAVSRLGDRERDIVALRFAAGLSNREIARLTGLSESNVGVILYRTLQRLRAELNAKESDDGRARMG